MLSLDFGYFLSTTLLLEILCDFGLHFLRMLVQTLGLKKGRTWDKLQRGWPEIPRKESHASEDMATWVHDQAMNVTLPLKKNNISLDTCCLKRGRFVHLLTYETRNPKQLRLHRQVETARVDYFGQLDRCCKLLPALRHLWSRGLHWIAGCEGGMTYGERSRWLSSKRKRVPFVFWNADGKGSASENSCCSYFVISP